MILRNFKSRAAQLLASGTLALALLPSCDSGGAYVPEVKADITEFEIYGQRSSRIDIDSRTVTVVLPEDAEPDALNIRRVRFSMHARCQDPDIADGKPIDLSSDREVVLSSDREYVWTVRAARPVEYHVTCEGQVGDAAINADAHTVCVTVKTTGSPYEDSRMKLKIMDMKLGRNGSRVVSTVGYDGAVQVIESFPVVLDCFFERTFTVEDHGAQTVWTMITLPAQ